MGLRGPQPGAACAVCNSPDSAAINAMLSQGTMSRRDIAKMFGLGKDSVTRHALRLHPGYSPPGTPTRDPSVPAESGATGEGASERDRLLVIRAQLESEMLVRPRSDLSRELRQVNQRVAEIDGSDRPRAATVADVRGLPEQLRRWFEALEPFPEARDAMLAATDRELLDSAGVAAPPPEG